MYKIILLCASLLLVTACSDKNNNKVSQDKVTNPLQTQVDAMEKARNVENLLQDADAQHRQVMDQQGK